MSFMLLPGNTSGLNLHRPTLIRAPLCQLNDAQNIPRIIRLDWDLDLAVKSFGEGPVVFDVCRACF